MLLCLPPVTTVQFAFYYYTGKPRSRRSRHYGDHYVRGRVENKRGVTFGDVIQKFLAKAGVSGSALTSEGCTICVQPSMIWMLGVIFPTENEVEVVESASK